MPIIDVEFDDSKVNKEQIKALSESMQHIVSDVTGIADVFVYANSAQVKVKIAPLEIFVRMSAHKITDEDQLLQQITQRLKAWKLSSAFPHPINLTLIPMQWKIEIGI